MKIIEAMKRIKELQMKADDLRKKIGTYCADNTHETPVYGTEQEVIVAGWLQAHSDIMKEVLKLRIQIQKTNLTTEVEVELDGKRVKKTIAEWIHRRRDLANQEAAAWGMLSDRGLREGSMQTSTGGSIEVKIRRYYKAKERDEKIMLYKSEPGIIDRTLEVVNAVTDIVLE